MTHEAKVEAVARAVREAAAAGVQVRPFKRRGVSHVVPLPKDGRFTQRPVDVTDLDRVLEIDRDARTCVAEPGVPFSRLVTETLANGLLPTVVPELEGITIGGAVAGCSVEGMSYKYGGFHDSAIEYEVVTGEGDVLACSPDREPHAFGMMHGSYGTLALLTRLKFRLVPAKPFVKLEYRRYDCVEAFHAAMLERCRADDFDFVDGIIHGPREHVLCLGRFTDAPPYVSTYRWLKVFYKSTRVRTEDYLTTHEYCFRYDTECHWLTRTFPPLEWWPVRLLVGKWVLGSTNVIRTYKRLEPLFGLKRRPDVVCDVFIPDGRFEDFCRWYERDYDFWPLWVVPYRIPKPYPWVSPGWAKGLGDFVIDCAVYGKPNEDPAVDASEQLERKTFELGGIKTLISRNHYTPEAFWQVYDRAALEDAKRRLDPRGAFPDFFTQFHRVG